jgi:hypothetical protein
MKVNNINIENEWFFCDECKTPIKENKIKYECEKCELIVCKPCFKTITHVHTMKKSKVPLGCKAPEDWMDLIDHNIHKCNNCDIEIDHEYWFICEECTDLKFCKTCRGIGKSIHVHKLKKVKFI